jgi:carbamoyltransferase
VDFVTFYDKPFLKFERLLETYLAFAPRGFSSFATAMPVWIKEKLFQKRLLVRQLSKLQPNFVWQKHLLFAEHHKSHAASAFYPSPFDDAAVLTMDGVGEWATTSVSVGSGADLQMVKELRFPHSLGLLYSAFTYQAGFKVNSGEYKVMGLAPYGEPIFAQTILDNLVDLKADGTFRLDQSFFDYCTGLRMTNERFDGLFGGPPRHPDDPLTQLQMDLAASIQAVAETIVLRLTQSVAAETGAKNLCLAGGVALNCVANGKVLREGHFENVWIQPAAGDAGGALGAALVTHHEHLGGVRVAHGSGDGMSGSYLGPGFSQSEVEKTLESLGAKFQVLDDNEFISTVAGFLAQGKVVGWFQGRMEFGPRALGSRSILGDPRSPDMQRTLNLRVKRRESFRPFAPSVLAEHAREYFELGAASPYMQFVAGVTQGHRTPLSSDDASLAGLAKLGAMRSDVPAVTHVDYSARIQTVHGETNPKYHALVSAFHGLTGCPVLINTSFNVRGEPIVCTPKDAFDCFAGTDIDVLAMENCLVLKEDQDIRGSASRSTSFTPD